MKKTLVIGASENPERYSYKAIHMLREYVHPVVAISKKKGQTAGIDFCTDKVHFNDIDTVTLYVGPKNQSEFYDYIVGLAPRRVIFNPGTENGELIDLLREKQIEAIEACTLVMLRTGQF